MPTTVQPTTTVPAEPLVDLVKLATDAFECSPLVAITGDERSLAIHVTPTYFRAIEEGLNLRDYERSEPPVLPAVSPPVDMAIRPLLSELGFGVDGTLARISSTRALDGEVSAEGERARAFWPFHPDSGLNLSIDLSSDVEGITSTPDCAQVRAAAETDFVNDMRRRVETGEVREIVMVFYLRDLVLLGELSGDRSSRDAARSDVEALLSTSS